MVFQTISLLLVFCGNVISQGQSQSQSSNIFAPAIQAINQQKVTSGNIDYATFCLSKVDVPDDQLFGCRLKAPNSGFLLRVCRLDLGCEALVKSRLAFSDSVKVAGLKVVKFSMTLISGIKCQGEAKTSCWGYVDEWIEDIDAMFVKVNEKIYNKQDDLMIEDIKAYQTTPNAKSATVTDLSKILTWMTPPDGQCTMYKQVCDLEGFFKKTGGFEILSPIVREKMMLEDFCHSEKTDPTTEQVIAVLKKFIKALSPAPQNPAPSSG